jgi:hypothetical protein
MYPCKDKPLHTIIINFKLKYFISYDYFIGFSVSLRNNSIIALKIPEEKVDCFKFKLWSKGYVSVYPFRKKN